MGVPLRVEACVCVDNMFSFWSSSNMKSYFTSLFTQLAGKPVVGIVLYGNGEFDGQGSGHDFYGTLYTPPIGWRNNTDGGRSVSSLTTARHKKTFIRNLK